MHLGQPPLSPHGQLGPQDRADVDGPWPMRPAGAPEVDADVGARVAGGQSAGHALSDRRRQGRGRVRDVRPFDLLDTAIEQVGDLGAGAEAASARKSALVGRRHRMLHTVRLHRHVTHRHGGPGGHDG